MRYILLLLLPIMAHAETLYTFEIGYSVANSGCYSPTVGLKLRQHDKDVEYSAGWINPVCGQSTPYMAISHRFVKEYNLNELVYAPGLAWVINKGDTFKTNYQMINHAHITHDDFYMGATGFGKSNINFVSGNRQKPTPKNDMPAQVRHPGIPGGNSLPPAARGDDGPMSPPSGYVPIDGIHEQEIEGGVIDPNIPHDFTPAWFDPLPPYDD